MSRDFKLRPTFNGAGLALLTEASGLSLTTVEVDLGSVPRRSGAFNITGTGMTTNDPVLVRQASGPYTNKGTRADEAQMDAINVVGKVTSATNIQCFWNSVTRVKGNFKFDYAVG